MPEFKVPLVWQEYGHVYVNAATKEEAIAYALGPECPLPQGDYVDDSVIILLNSSCIVVPSLF